MIDQTLSIDQIDDPCRIVIIGLPYSGKRQVAKILCTKYNCQFIEIKDKNPDMELSKVIAKSCFQDFRGKAVLIMDECDYKTLTNLKKRNFVNIIKVDAAFKIRIKHYCQANKKEMNLEAFQQFSSYDASFQNNEYQKCQDLVRVRLYNDGDYQKLERQVDQRINEIIRPFRPNYDEYFMKIADIAKRRSNCMKSSVGCVIVNDNNRIVSTGYNGTPRGLESCFREGCSRCNANVERGLDECLCLHGEQSAILEIGIARTYGCKLYTTLYPCFSCAKIIKQAGIKKIYYMTEYLKYDNGEKFLKQNYKPEDVIKVNVSNIYY